MKMYDIQGDPTLQSYARALDASGDYHVLRRLPRLEEMWLAPTTDAVSTITLGIIDTETTGLADTDSIIEIAVSKMVLVDGQVADVTTPMSMLEDPGVELSADVQRITGIRNEDVAGQAFNEHLLAIELADVDALVAFNARFDAAHLRRRFPGLRHPWICARADWDWAAAGFAGRSQSQLLAELGHFYPAHRASADVWALAVLIASAAPDGRAIAAHLVDHGRTIEARIAAAGAPYATKDLLKARGYRWQANKSVWCIDLPLAACSDEVAALARIHPSIRPAIEDVDWYNRHIN